MQDGFGAHDSFSMAGFTALLKLINVGRSGERDNNKDSTSYFPHTPCVREWMF
jgi:hypothetical protein